MVSRSPVLAAPLLLRVTDAFGNSWSDAPSASPPTGSSSCPWEMVLTLRPSEAAAAAPRHYLPAPGHAASAGGGGTCGGAGGADTDHRRAAFYPDGCVALSAPLVRGEAIFGRIELAAEQGFEGGGDGGGGGSGAALVWQPGRYLLRAELRHRAQQLRLGSGAPGISAAAASCSPTTACLELSLDVFTDVSEREATLLAETRALMQRRAQLQGQEVRRTDQHHGEPKKYFTVLPCSC